MVILAFRCLLLLIIFAISAYVFWRIARTIPEVRVLLRLDDIKSSESLAQSISKVDEFKHVSNKKKVRSFISKKDRK